MPFVSLQNADRKPVIKNRQQIKDFIPVLFDKHDHQLESLTIVFCSDEYLLSLNRDFLHHDYYTDILTFDLGTAKKITGEIYISVDRVKENALTLSVSFQQEILRVIFHGVLHLCGFGDKTLLQKKKMIKNEDEALQKFRAFHVKQ